MNLRSKTPSIRQISQVFAVTFIMIYGWTTYGLIQRLSGWLYYLNIQEILSNYSYALVINFIETILFIGLILIINFLLPKRFFMDLFVARGSLFSMLGLGYLIYLALAVGQSKSSQFPEDLFKRFPFVALVLFLMAVLLPQFEIVKKLLEGFADRAVIFLYIFLPLTGIGLLLLIFNNLF